MILSIRSKFGFTLVELVTVIVLLSVLSVLALSRLGGVSGFERRAYFEEVVNALRYAQKLALSTGCNVRVDVTSSSYRLRQATTCTASTFDRNVVNPANRTVAYQNLSPPDGITISPAASMTFTPQSSVTGLSGDTVFSVGSLQFTVFQNTGLVDAN